MDRNRAQGLARLAALAAMKRDAELAKLATVARSRARLQEALVTVRSSEAPLDPGEEVSDPALVAARLAHRRWSEGQARRLNQQLAMLTVDWLRQKPAAAKAFGRAAVLDQLAEKAQNDLRAKSARSD
ncbi:MAG: hypothetical protein ACK4GT_15355 [Pararhodobacter sp.]